MKKYCLVIIAVMLMAAPGWSREKAQQADSFYAGPLTRKLDDVGCAFELRGKDWDSPSWFISGLDGAWMNFDGKDVKLESVDENDNHYQYGDIDIHLDTGHGKQNEAGVTYKRARLILTRNGQRSIIKLSGGCGC